MRTWNRTLWDHETYVFKHVGKWLAVDPELDNIQITDRNHGAIPACITEASGVNTLCCVNELLCRDLFSSLGWWLWTTHHLDVNSSRSSSVMFSGRMMQVATDVGSIIVTGSNGSQIVPPLDVFAPVVQSREATLSNYDKGRHSCQSRSSRSNPSYKSL